MFSTKFMTISHFPGFPVYIMWGALIQSFYSEGSVWGLALFGSTIPAILTIVMVFFITRKLTDNKWSPYVAALGLAGASAYFSQTIIPEVYSFSIFMMVLTWFLLIYGKYSLGAIAAGLACFPSGTHIVVESVRKWKNQFCEGFATQINTKRIEDVKIGDKVLTYNEKTGKKELKRVVKIYNENKVEELYTVTFSNGNEIKCTSDHPIGVYEKGNIKWVDAQDLSIGDECLQYRYPNLIIREKRLHRKRVDIFGCDKANNIAESIRTAKKGTVSILKGKTYEDYFGRERSNEIKARQLIYQLGRESWNKNLTKTSDERVAKSAKKLSQTMIKLFSDEFSVYSSKEFRSRFRFDVAQATSEYWDNFSRGVHAKPNKLEKVFQYHMDKEFPLWEYTGDFSFWVIGDKSRRNPDFKHKTLNKVIEVFSPYWKEMTYGTVDKYKEITTNFYNENGYEVVYFSEQEVYDDIDNVIKVMRNFTFNAELVCVTNIVIERVVQKRVYNLGVDSNHNYFANGILVHNCGTHVFAGPAILAMFFYYVGFRKKWYWFIPFAVLPYLYVVFGAVRSEWNASLPAGSGIEGFLRTYVWGTIYDNFKYWGAIAIWNFPKRLFETAVLLTTSFGLALIPMFYYFKDWKKAGFLIACITVPAFYYVGCNVETAYVHFTLAFPFFAVAAGLGLNKFKLHPSMILFVSGVLLLIFPLSFDIGNTLDKELSAYNMYKQIEQIPDRSVVFGYCENLDGKQTVGGREQVGIMYYDRLHNKSIVPLNTGWLVNTDKVGDKSVSEWNKKTLESFGLIVPELIVIEDLDAKLSKEERVSITLENMTRLKKSNPDRKFYITKTVSDETGNNYNFGRRLIEW